MSNGTIPQLIDAVVVLLSPRLGIDEAKLRAQLAQSYESGASSYDLAKADWKFGK